MSGVASPGRRGCTLQAVLQHCTYTAASNVSCVAAGTIAVIQNDLEKRTDAADDRFLARAKAAELAACKTLEKKN